MTLVVDTHRKRLPFGKDLWDEIAQTYGTPLYVYDEAGICANARRLQEAFSWIPDYQNFFAVKATPTPAILRLIAGQGMGFDCSSRGELEMIRRESLADNGVFYSSNNTADDDYAFAFRLGATINLDKFDYVDQVRRVLETPPKRMAIRYNPGDFGVGSSIIGFPRLAKFGARRDDVVAGVVALRRWGVESVGLHTMVVSNERDPAQFAATASVVSELAIYIEEQTGRRIDFVNLGGGLGVTYHAADPEVDVLGVGAAIRGVLGNSTFRIMTEHGRYITGPHGYLLTRITHGIQRVHQPFLQVDTSINNIARLATVTAAYHQLDVLGRENDLLIPMNVTGSMCANTDVMFRSAAVGSRPGCMLPETSAPGDLLVIHDAGAHCRANSHNYNFQLRCGEVLVGKDGSHSLIRRHETIDDLLRTTDGL